MDEAPEGVEVPWRQLDDETLRRLIEELVTREGTDNGVDVPLDARVRSVREQLRLGTAAVVFDPVSESASIVARDRRSG